MTANIYMMRYYISCYMLHLMTDYSGHFTPPELSLWWSDLHEIKSVRFYITSFK